MTDRHRNLRNRKRTEPSGEVKEGKLKDEAGTAYEEKERTTKSTTTSSSLSSHGYVIIPLRQRSILTRLDVGPFLILYGFLVSLDFKFGEELTTFSHVLFPFVLLLHLALFLVQQWNVSWRVAVGYNKMLSSSPKTIMSWTHCFVEAPHVEKHQSSHDAGIIAVEQRVLNHESTEEGKEILTTVNFQDIVFRCNVIALKGIARNKNDADHFLWSLSSQSPQLLQENNDITTPNFHRIRYPINLPISFYNDWRGHKSMEKVIIAQQTYGTNSTPIELPPFLHLLQEQVVAPFFLFQILCCLLWSLDEYWYYAIFTFFALLMFESTVAYNRMKSLERLRSYTVQSQRPIWVYRPTYPPLGKNGWVQISVMELVPGDIVSCKQIILRSSSPSDKLMYKQQQMNRIPADILILNGDVVVDESQITGESIPQLKLAIKKTSMKSSSDDDLIHNAISNPERINRNQDEEILDLQEHKQHIMFGGTTLIVSHTGECSIPTLPEAPNQGAIGMVLRTGFETAQGSLLRTMAHTQKSVDGIHTRDTYAFILILLCCAVASAFMVWEEGNRDQTRNKFRLTLHVIIIVTSVIPPELPMELSLAVTNSVADLIKRKIFCTEVFRIPLAGQVNVCCFDKTGTLTSDEMQLKGVIVTKNIVRDQNVEGAQKKNVKNDINFNLNTMNSFTDVIEPGDNLPWSALRIMTACHSLAMTEGVNSKNNECQAGSLIGNPLEKAVFNASGYKMIKNNALVLKNEAADRPETILVLQRFNFTSKLKRMSVLVRESKCEYTWVLSKGAPETLKRFLRSDTVPHNYDEISMQHMSRGTRVLTMAYRKLNSNELKKSIDEISRDTVESDLIFAGFLLLHCPLKSDSGRVVSELWNSGSKVVMITGDALLTACEVARQVGIIQKKKALKSFPSILQLKYVPTPKNSATKNDFCDDFRFIPLSANGEVEYEQQLTLSTQHLSRLQKMVGKREIALCMSGDTLQMLALEIVQKTQYNDSMEQDNDKKQVLLHPASQNILKSIVPLCAVFARCNPRQKEAIIAAFNLGGYTSLMCGDGTNDVGALRRSHVGISIISDPDVEAKQRTFNKNLSEAKALQKKERKKKGSKKSSRFTNSSALEKSLKHLQQVQDDLDQIELGDASIASPFTSRVVSIQCCRDVLIQGRCTLVTMLQIYKILGVNCLVNAMILSKLYLHGVKQGDRQLTILGLFVAGLFFFVTRGKPLQKLSALHPPTSILCSQAFLSIFCQVVIHFTAMIIAAEVALSFVDPYDPSIIPDGPFNPNTLNTCTFLVSVLATVNTFAVNYRGEPFVEPLRSNKTLLRTLQLCYVTLFACALEIFPPLNDLFQLAEFPDTTHAESLEWMTDFTRSTSPLVASLTEIVKSIGFKSFILAVMICDTVLVFMLEKLIISTFEK